MRLRDCCSLDLLKAIIGGIKMAKRHFIAVLGTGRYKASIYSLQGREAKATLYVQEALIELAMGELQEEDKITIFLTEMARKMNWENREYTEQDRVDHEKIGTVRLGLKSVLQDRFGKDKVEEFSIPEGKNEEELDVIFKTMYGCIEKEEEVYFDITHGLRNIPMQALVVLNYARALKNITIAGIYYGAFEVNKSEEREGRTIPIAPVLNLNKYSEILDWTSAAEEFVHTGNCVQAGNLYQREHDKYVEQIKMAENNEKRQEAIAQKMEVGVVGNAINCIQKLMDCINTGRGYEFKKEGEQKSIRNAYEKFQESIKDLDNKKLDYIKPLKPLLEIMLQQTSIFEDSQTMGEFGIAATQWAVEHKMTQQGLTALEETIKTIQCEKFDMDPLDIDLREYVVKKGMMALSIELQNKANRENRKMKEIMEDVDECFYSDVVSNWEGIVEQEFNTENISDAEKKKKREKKKQQVLELGRRFIHMVSLDMVMLSMEVSNTRNDINHFGMRKNAMTSDDLQSKLEEVYQECQKKK